MDDEPDVVTVLIRLACDRGYEATGVVDAAEVLPILRTPLSPDVILLDLNMPRMGGREILSEIVGRPGAPAVIVMSGWVDAVTYEVCRRFGAADVVRKPFDVDDLFRRVDAAARLVGDR